MQKTIAISTGPSTHLDHLGILCCLLEIPLIVSEERIYNLAKKYYPDLDVYLKDPLDISISFLSEFDNILQCGQFWATELIPLIELLHHKRIRMIFCPHGNSDKGHVAENLPVQDIVLVYGRQMTDFIRKKTSSIKHLVSVGNYRFPYYRKQQNFYDGWAEKEVFSYLNPRKKTLLYAPSWNDGENLSSFFTSSAEIIKQMTPHFNLILKPHPLLEEESPAATEHLLSLCENNPQCVVLKEFPPIYPLLAKASAYLGDFSSIGYDFLAFDRPLFFLNGSNSSLLHKSGMCIPSDTSILTFIETNWHYNQSTFSPMRRKLYHYAFDAEKSILELKNALSRSLYGSHPASQRVPLYD